MEFYHHDTFEIISSEDQAKTISDLIDQGEEYLVVYNKLLREIAKIGNFTTIYQFATMIYSRNKSQAFVPVNGITFDVNEVFGGQWYDDINSRVSHITSSAIERIVLLVVTPGEPFTAYEKLFFPFDLPTWISLCCTFLIAFAVIFVVNLKPRIIQEVFYGVGVNSPSLNVLGSFFGIGQNKLPKNNFGRIILIFFVYFCLVFRVGYQGEIFKLNYKLFYSFKFPGVFYEMLTTDMRKQPIKSIAEILEENIPVFTTDRASYIAGASIIFNTDDR